MRAGPSRADQDRPNLRPTGKFGEQTGRGALVGYAGTEKYSGSYDLLIATPDEVKWVDQDGPLASAEGLNPVDGGHDGQGHKLYVAHVAIDKAIVPGKAFDGCQGGQAAFAGKESQPIQVRASGPARTLMW